MVGKNNAKQRGNHTEFPNRVKMIEITINKDQKKSLSFTGSITNNDYIEVFSYNQENTLNRLKMEIDKRIKELQNIDWNKIIEVDWQRNPIKG